MWDYKENVFKQYGGAERILDDGQGEDGRHGWSRSTSLEFYYTKKHLNNFIKPTDRVLELGCATGYYAFYFADKCREYVGVDLFPPHIELFRKKIADRKLTNITCEVGDAAELSNFADASFDVVLCLGPMYHLPPEKRSSAFAECARICKPEGIAAFGYINRVGVYAGACIQEKFRDHYPNTTTNDYVFRLNTDDEKPGVFYFTMPEEIETEAARSGFSKLRNLGVDFFITMGIVDAMDDEKFELFRPLADQMSSHESCTGMSNHALLICRRE
jgi:Methylase involved in ubiquinone/menaquinone biosynthesis